jgi:hypothetical protein
MVNRNAKISERGDLTSTKIRRDVKENHLYRNVLALKYFYRKFEDNITLKSNKAVIKNFITESSKRYKKN